MFVNLSEICQHFAKIPVRILSKNCRNFDKNGKNFVENLSKKNPKSVRILSKICLKPEKRDKKSRKKHWRVLSKNIKNYKNI
jgi:hypothetical protein